jgi:predicted dienelactone hydrolase
MSDRVRRLAVANPLCAALAFFALAAQASTGITEVPGVDGDGPVTVFYPSSSAAQPLKRGRFTFELARDGAPVKGNGHLVVISHGSGGSPWAHENLARTLVNAGFIVAVPTHRGDNYRDSGTPGPESWERRPAEVSHAIDAVTRDPRFASLAGADRVGVYGMSAGGHTALTFAGGRWSRMLFREHCEAHIADDFPACVGLAARLRGDFLDPVKESIALAVIRWRFDDPSWHTYNDPRVKAAVAAVPFAADFDMDSLAAPRIALGLVTVGKDRWLRREFHAGAVLKACKSCELVADIADGGHGALLSPFPPGLGERAALLLDDPPGFDRGELPAVDWKITAFFQRHLLD